MAAFRDRLVNSIHFFGLSIVFWTVVAILVSFQQSSLAAEEHLPFTFSGLLALNAVRYLTVALLTPPIFYLTSRWPASGSHVSRRVVGYVAGYGLFSVSFAFIRWCLYPSWDAASRTWASRTVAGLWTLSYVTFADVLLIYIGLVVAGHAYTYFLRNQKQEIERAKLLQVIAESELHALRAQIHPHFLFNTLHAISTLTSSDPKSARTMLVKLSDLLRTALRYGGSDLIALSGEVEFIESYLDIEKMRLGDRLEVSWKISPAVRESLVPQLILQPLVENAVVHGVACCRDGGWIKIEAEETVNTVWITVSNSVGGKSHPGTGFGIPNTRSRLKYLYADQACFDFSEISPGIVRAKVVIPKLRTCTPAQAEVQTVTPI
ncbi:MAG: histidine kinase [Acidobacteriaceae bacterium]